MNEILRFMQKRDEWTHIRKAFYNLPTMAFGRRREIITQDMCICGVREGHLVEKTESFCATWVAEVLGELISTFLSPGYHFVASY